MPVDDRDERSPTSPETGEEPSAVPPMAETPTDSSVETGEPTPTVTRISRRHIFTRRHAMFAGLAIVAGILLLLIVAVVLYRTGRIDRLIADQITGTLAEYGIRTDIKEFHTKFGPRTVEMQDVELYDAKTNERIGKIAHLLAVVRIEDLYALNLHRDINLESLDIDGLEAWVSFDAEGRSNFRNLHIPPPTPNERILFSYSTALVKLSSAVIHYGDALHNLSGEARNVRATVQPDDPNAPAASWMDTVDLALSNSTFVYDGRPVNDIGIEAHGRVNQTRAELRDIVLRSPVAEVHLQGTMDDWRALRYQLQVTSNVDLTQVSDVLQPGTALRGTGQLTGNLSGEGTRYQFNGGAESDALAADGVRLKAARVTNVQASGDGADYNIQARAVAELLTAGDFQLNVVQLAGGVMGTGTDFRWVGELRAAGARQGGLSIAGLILSDTVAEYRDGRLDGSAGRIVANRLSTGGAVVGGAQVQALRFKTAENGEATASASGISAGDLVASGARVNGLKTGGVTAEKRGTTTSVAINDIHVGGASAAGAQIGSLNIAGVRLAINNGRVEGTSSDINVGTVAFKAGAESGRADNVRVAHPVFTVEPAGRYRVSADLSVGGGVLGQMNLGAARSQVVATNNQVQLNNFTAGLFNGHASGNATVSTARGGASHIAANFSDLDVAKLIGLSGHIVPVAATTTGTVDLRFPGTDIASASGNLNAQFSGETGNDTSGRTPLSGNLALEANRGIFNIQQASLRTPASQLSASGQFSLESDSNLQVNLASTDATELQRVVESSGLVPNLEENLSGNGLELAGNLGFNGTVRGKLSEPSIQGRATLGSIRANGHDLGTLAASITATPTDIRVADGRLTQPDGGGVQFNLDVPLVGENNISVDATLDRVDAGNLIAAVPGLGSKLGSVRLRSAVSGRVSATGLLGAMNGSADLRFGPGTINNEPFDQILARATLNGSTISLENLDARFRAGRITASGTLDTTTQAFSVRASGSSVRLDSLGGLAANEAAGVGSLPQLSGTFDFDARASGEITKPTTYQVNFDGKGHNVAINGRSAGDLTLVGRTENRQFNLQLTTGLLGQPQVIAAHVDLSNENLPTTIETTLSNVNLDPLFAALLPAVSGGSMHVTGRATGTLLASGNLYGDEGFSLAGLHGTANFTELVVQVQDVQLAAENPLIVQFSSNEVTFERTRFTGPGTNITFGGTAALGEGGRENFSIDGDLNLRLLNTFSPNNFFAGMAHVVLRVGGSYADPRVNGTASVAGASFSTLLSDERLTLANINGGIRFTTNVAQIESLTATLGSGRLEVTGGALLQGFMPTQFRFNVRGENVSAPLPYNIRASADTDLVIQGSPQAQVISGAVNLRRAEYTQDIDLADIINSRRGGGSLMGGGGGAGGGLTASTQLDISVQGRDALVVRNNLADIVGSVSLQVQGTIDSPQISGRISATRGTLNFRNDRYELTRAYIDIPPEQDLDPILNIQAESEIRGYRVIVGLTGSLSAPQAVLRSDPALPEADVVSLITTGNLASGNQSTAAETGVGTAASLLTDALINNRTQRATDRLFGLNRFEIDPLITGRSGSSPTARLTLGRQINRNLSLTYSTNVTADQNQVVAVEYRVSNRLSFVAQYEQSPVSGLRVQDNNVFSFEIRFRKRF